jgi:DNA processing protein
MVDDLRQLVRGEYPSRLREIPKPPAKLWARGTFPSKETKLLAVVGSRALTDYGREVCEELIAGLAGYPISIVSGLALGTDACAHRAAIDAGLHTIAVPGSGLNDDVIYPRTNFSLAKDILASGGLLLSEQEPNHKPYMKEFPSRNRVMVGLSHAVLVIEAGPASGTLITARLAHEYNRDLLCVPHRIGDPHAYAAHLFIRLGATLVSDPLHILEALGIPPYISSEQLGVRLEGNEKRVYETLTKPMTRRELVKRSRLTSADALSALVTLDLKGAAKEQYGAWRRT